MDYFNIAASAAGSWTVATGQAFLDRVNINISGAASRVSIFDGTSTAGAPVAVIDATAARSHDYGRIRCENGIFVQNSAGTPNLTISFE